MKREVEIEGVVFETWPTDYDDAFVIEPGGLIGWEDGVEIRREETARPTGIGAFRALGYPDARVVTIRGTILANTPQRLKHKANHLRGLLTHGESRRMTVRGDEVEWADVQLAPTTRATPDTSDATECPFEITVWAADPRKYGDTRRNVTGSTIELWHRGNTAAVPKFIVTGPSSAYTITGPDGEQFVVTQSLSSGQKHVVDFGLGHVYLDGVLQTGVTARTHTWTIPPGTKVSASISTGTMRAEWWDTWL